ncbi:MAG: dihydrolipoyl dehydrogenase [Solirubrobacteraceae bacterium]|nr:dihydrolipoyl dehydrogenase [Solirubrobacteraceae bacterium]
MAQFDTIVIGSGPGGYVTAVRSAQLGLKTLVVEKDTVGGRCLNYACIPAKAVLRSADVLHEIRRADEFGLQVQGVSVDFAAVQQRRKDVISQLTGGVAGLLKKNGVDYLSGEASLAGGGDVTVGGETHTAKHIILAAGSVRRAIPGVEYGGRVIGTEEAWALDELPGSIAVVGAGASGTEIASAYARLGANVQLFEFLDRVLPSEDVDISRVANREFKKQGIDVHVSTKVADVQTTDDEVTFTFQKGDGDKVDGRADWLVIATGRAPDVEALGLDVAGVKTDEKTGLIQVDGRLRTSVKGIWAIGDLVPGPALAHKSSDEGVIAVEDAKGLDTHPISYVDIPRATFCQPNVGSFGLTEAQAKEQGHDVVVGKVPYGAVGGATVYGESGTIKIVGEKKYGELLGGHIVGAKATEMIQELVNAKALEGGYAEVARTIHGHPTLSEGVMEAARAADGWLIHG